MDANNSAEMDYNLLMIFVIAQMASLVAQLVKKKKSNHSAGDLGLIPGLEISPGEGNGNPLQYSFLGNPMDTGACSPGHRATVHRLTRVGHD